MERLANRLCSIINEQDFCFTPDEMMAVEKAIRCLAAYEDTGLEPEVVTAVKHSLMGKAIAEIKEFDGIPVDRLRELAQAEQDGRLVVLPEYAICEVCPLCCGDCGNCHITGYPPDPHKCRAVIREAADAALEGGDEG